MGRLVGSPRRASSTPSKTSPTRCRWRSCQLLGVPLEEEPQFSQATDLLAQALDPFVGFTGSMPSGFEERPSLRRLAAFLKATPLARLEAGMALSAITARFPYARLDSEPQYKANVALRGLSELTVAV